MHLVTDTDDIWKMREVLKKKTKNSQNDSICGV